MNRTIMIANKLKAAGIEVTKVTISDFPDIEDDTIYLPNNRHIQVGQDYQLIGTEVGECLHFTKPLTIAEIIHVLLG